MKILIIGGMHGNEPLGINLVNQLQKQPIKNVDAIIANPKAKKVKQRFTSKDLNRSFPGDGSAYEDKRASEILELCKNYDLVLDFHNTNCPGNDCAFVGEDSEDLLIDTAGYMDLKRIIVADYDCINKYAPNCVSVEISLDSPHNNVGVWTTIIERLANIDRLPSFEGYEKYKFVYRMSLEDKEKLNLENAQLRAFEKIPAELASAMNVASPAYPIFINDAYTPYNYGGLLNKID